MINLRSLVSWLATIFAGIAVFAAAPSGYYEEAEGKSDKTLYVAIGSIINNHIAKSYDYLWTAFKTTDIDNNGKIWDMYSNKRWTPGREQCGTYKGIGDCYNREHSFPKSWFNDAMPMYSDLFHLYPTDGKVNGQRSNYPFGECANGSYVASSGSVKALGKLGASTFAGYSGTVFEPDDEYKGDFARTYFYMAVCYSDRNKSWNSDMLAGNDFPFFKDWAIKLLLKWHRQDPVSDKETKRNDEVYKIQNNRNPFIDYPELAEHIWGNKKGYAWNSTAGQSPEINVPVDGSTVDFGVTAKNSPVLKTITLKTTNVKDNVIVSATEPFAVNDDSFSASETNAGVQLKVQYQPTDLGSHTGKLTVACGDLCSTVNLIGSTVDGLPAGKATDITSESFTANWIYIGDDMNGKYDFTVTDADGVLSGYPIQVDAKAGSYVVRGLMPETTYTYYVRSNQFTSDGVIVTTAEALPFVDFLFDGELYFSTVPGEPSAEAEILVQIENITTDITVSVKAPFELSLNRSDWSQSVILTPDESRIYLRMNSATAGIFESSLVATAGEYVNDNAVVSGIANDRDVFFEDFEATPAPASSYNTSTYNGTAAVWNLYNTGYWADTDKGHDDSATALRLGKASNNLCAVEMADAKHNGVGVVSFWAKKWNDKEANSTIAVETSTDNANWKSVGNVTITGATWQEYTVTANVPGDVRVRFRRTQGARMHFDDVTISDYSSGVSDPAAERHQWDAYSLNGELIVKVDKADGIDIGIYTVSGVTLFEGRLAEGLYTRPLERGTFVLVSSGDFTRTVLIR